MGYFYWAWQTKAVKSAGPDQIPPRYLKEFNYELSVPLTDILNGFFLVGSHQISEKAIVVPILKQYSPTIDKLSPMSLTSVFEWNAKG